VNNKYLNQPIKIKEIPLEDRPREKLKQNGISSLSDLELVAIILGTGIKGFNALQISEQVLEILDKKKYHTRSRRAIDNTRYRRSKSYDDSSCNGTVS